MFQNLSNKPISSKTYQSILKTFLNDKKIPCIPPAFHINKFVIDFKEKTELFNTLFAEQCSLPKNNSEVPEKFLFLTEKRLSNAQVSDENTIKIINNLDYNKAHGHDMISIRILKLCGPSLCKPFSIIFKSCLKFSMEWKKPNVVPMINSTSRITDLPLCFQPAVRSLKDFYLTTCTSF